MHRFGLNPHLELIYQLFKKPYFRDFGAYSGPYGPKKASIIGIVTFGSVLGFGMPSEGLGERFWTMLAPRSLWPSWGDVVIWKIMGA